MQFALNDLNSCISQLLLVYYISTVQKEWWQQHHPTLLQQFIAYQYLCELSSVKNINDFIF